MNYNNGNYFGYDAQYDTSYNYDASTGDYIANGRDWDYKQDKDTFTFNQGNFHAHGNFHNGSYYDNNHIINPSKKPKYAPAPKYVNKRNVLGNTTRNERQMSASNMFGLGSAMLGGASTLTALSPALTPVSKALSFGAGVTGAISYSLKPNKNSLDHYSQTTTFGLDMFGQRK